MGMKIDDFHKVYTVTTMVLSGDDGKTFTAEDVVFTINLIKNSLVTRANTFFA